MQAFRAAQVFDGSAFLGPGTVLVEGESIVDVQLGHQELPDGTEVAAYDGTLLPGLIDSHVHLVANGDVGSLERASAASDDELHGSITASLQAQVAGGVTTVQDLGDVRYLTLEHRARTGLPRVVGSGPPVTSPGGHCHYLGGAAQGVVGVTDAVREHAEHGVDVVKVMATGGMVTMGTDIFTPQFSDEELAACLAAAHGSRLRVLAHAHAVAGVEQAVRLRVDGIEHFTCLTESGAVVPDHLLAAVAEAGITVDLTLGIDLALAPPPEALAPNFRATLERLGLDIPTFRASRIEHARRVRAHGIRVVSGTDAGAAPTKRHGGAWRAVVELGEAGYPVDGALVTATSGAADELGLGELTGRLRTGLSADLLAVDGDVQADPAALGRPVAVVVRGAHAS